MKEENEINGELRQLLDALEEQGRNARRKKLLSDLIDQLATQEKTVEMPRKHKKLIPVWWAISAAAACLLLWLVLKPVDKQAENTNETHYTEQTLPANSMIEEIQGIAPSQEPLSYHEPLAESEPIKAEKSRIKKEKRAIEAKQLEIVEKELLVEVEELESVDSNEVEQELSLKETSSEPLSAQTQNVTRRVIQSTTLVGYGKLDKKNIQLEPKRTILDNKTIFGQPLDSNMKGGMLAYEIKF